MKLASSSSINFWSPLAMSLWEMQIRDGVRCMHHCASHSCRPRATWLLPFRISDVRFCWLATKPHQIKLINSFPDKSKVEVERERAIVSACASCLVLSMSAHDFTLMMWRRSTRMAHPTERTTIKREGPRRGYGTAEQSPSLNFQLHEVQPSDTLLGISLKYGVATEEILRANKMYASDSIFMRKALKIPTKATKDGASVGVATSPSSARSAKPIARKEGNITDFLSKFDAEFSRTKQAVDIQVQNSSFPAAAAAAAAEGPYPAAAAASPRVAFAEQRRHGLARPHAPDRSYQAVRSEGAEFVEGDEELFQL